MKELSRKMPLFTESVIRHMTRISDECGVATIDSGKPGYTVLMRADIDALPVQEDAVNLSKPKVAVSKNEGYSHACGHDGHIAMLLTEGKILAEHTDEWEGKVILMFEQAEEFGERGGKHLLQYIQDQGIHVDTCYATHVRWDIPVGKMAVLDDGVMSGAFFFRVRLNGYMIQYLMEFFAEKFAVVVVKETARTGKVQERRNNIRFLPSLQ